MPEEALSQFGAYAYLDGHFWMCLRLTGSKKSGTDRTIRPARRIPSFELFF